MHIHCFYYWNDPHPICRRTALGVVDLQLLYDCRIFNFFMAGSDPAHDRTGSECQFNGGAIFYCDIVSCFAASRLYFVLSQPGPL